MPLRKAVSAKAKKALARWRKIQRNGGLQKQQPKFAKK